MSFYCRVVLLSILAFHSNFAVAKKFKQTLKDLWYQNSEGVVAGSSNLSYGTKKTEVLNSTTESKIYTVSQELNYGITDTLAVGVIDSYENIDYENDTDGRGIEEPSLSLNYRDVISTEHLIFISTGFSFSPFIKKSTANNSLRGNQATSFDFSIGQRVSSLEWRVQYSLELYSRTRSEDGDLRSRKNHSATLGLQYDVNSVVALDAGYLRIWPGTLTENSINLETRYDPYNTYIVGTDIQITKSFNSTLLYSYTKVTGKILDYKINTELHGFHLSLSYKFN